MRCIIPFQTMRITTCRQSHMILHTVFYYCITSSVILLLPVIHPTQKKKKKKEELLVAVPSQFNSFNLLPLISTPNSPSVTPCLIWAIPLCTRCDLVLVPTSLFCATLGTQTTHLSGYICRNKLSEDQAGTECYPGVLQSHKLLKC